MITPIYAAVLTVLLVVLMLRVVRLRWTHKVGLGDGGVAELRQAIRVHGNLVETGLWALLLLFMMEWSGVQPVWLHVYGIALVVARFLHAWGVTHSPDASFGRTAGTVITAVLLLTGAAVSLWMSL
ncbi:MAG: MAPEG family protein [Micavibrio sp.]